MEEKYRKLNETFIDKIKHLVLLKMKKQQNQKFITDFRVIQEIL